MKDRLVVLAITLAAAAAGEADASFPGENGRLVFTVSHDVSGVGTNELATVTRAGTRFRIIAGCSYECHYLHGDWSPSGRRVVYSHDFEIYQRVATVRFDGRRDKVVYRQTNGRPVEWPAVWSPDGRRIAFINWVSEWRTDIFVIDREGTHLTRITRTRPGEKAGESRETALDWSSRNRLVFVKRGDLFTMRPNGRGLRRLTNTDARESEPDWAPGGGRLTYVRDGEIWTMRASGENPRMIASGDSPAWAPDGSRIAFVSATDNAIHTVKPSGAEDTFLTRPRKWISGLDWQPR